MVAYENAYIFAVKSDNKKIAVSKIFAAEKD